MATLVFGLASACESNPFQGNGVFVGEETTGPNELTLTMRVGTRISMSGMRVDTVGQDTIVTRIDSDRARRFILTGLSGYRGRIGLKFVELVIGDTSVWIDDHNVKVHGPAGTMDVELLDENGEDRFGGRDLVLRGDRLAPAGSVTESR